MSCGNDGSTYVLTIRVANTNPAVIGAFTVQVAGHGFSAQVVDHPPFGVLSRSGAQLGCINAVQSHRGAINNDGIGISNVSTPCQNSCSED